MVNKKHVEKKGKTSSRKKDENKKKEMKEVRFCKDCKWYDKSSERDFHRKVGPKNEEGERTGIIEVRAICRNKKAKAYNRLVMAEYAKRQCPVWKKGTYKTSEKSENKKEKMTSPEEDFGSTEDHLKRIS